MWDIGILSKYLYLTQPCLLLLPMKKSCCDVGRSIFYLLQQYMKELFSTSVIIFLCTNCYILFFWLSENSLTLALNFSYFLFFVQVYLQLLAQIFLWTFYPLDHPHHRMARLDKVKIILAVAIAYVSIDDHC